ncbi:MAG TPA: YceH family protein [Solirubrobacteraceae bacterium]|nr:YceH family protein [Solirubrobacteraceae bacterium]
MIGPDPAEIRVLGALIEKQRATPDSYPLSLNALRLATNQATGREPVVDYDESLIRDAVARLVRRGWARLASGPGSRATKYRHLLDDALSLSGAELSVLAVLMLRGPQTPGELRLRTERLHRFSTLEELDAVLATLDQRRLIVRFDRRPGQKEARWSPGEAFGAAEQPDDAAAASALVALAADDDLQSRVAALERDLDQLRGLVERLRGGEA